MRIIKPLPLGAFTDSPALVEWCGRTARRRHRRRKIPKDGREKRASIRRRGSEEENIKMRADYSAGKQEGQDGEQD